MRSAQFGTDQTVPFRASLCVYMLLQHMAVPCCQRSLSPGPASPAWDRWRLTGPWKATMLLKTPSLLPSLTLALPVFPVALFPAASPHMPGLLCLCALIVSIQAEWKPNKQNVNIITFITHPWLQRPGRIIVTQALKSNSSVPPWGPLLHPPRGLCFRVICLFTCLS